MNNKTSVGSKVLTIAFCTLLVLLTIAAFVYLLVGPDFLTPDEYQQLYGTIAPTGPETPVDLDAEYEKALWNADMQDLLDYLEEKGYIDQKNKTPMTTIGTDNWICDGLDLIWWDVENLVEGTDAYNYWQEYQENGFIIFGGSIYAPVANGPFAVNVLSQFAGNVNQFQTDYMNFGKYLYEKNGGGTTVDLSVEYEKALWNGSCQDLLDYLEEKGYIKPSEKELLMTIGTESYIISGLEIMWWDVENLVEGTEPYNYWNEFEENGFIIIGGGIYAPTRYGPYAIKIRSDFAGNSTQLGADMEAFGQYLYEKNGGGTTTDLSAEYENALQDAAMQDLVDYLLELGYIKESDIQGMAGGVCTEGHVCKNGLDLLWWDVENLVETSDEYSCWKQYQDSGFIILSSGSIYTPTLYGPFGIWVNTGKFEGNENQLDADMENFGKYLYEKNHQ